MDGFSDVVADELRRKKKSISTFAREMEVSYQYVWRLVKKKKGRWNETTINRACEILGIEIKFISKSA